MMSKCEVIKMANVFYRISGIENVKFKNIHGHFFHAKGVSIREIQLTNPQV